jgi:hypothetical protein
MRCFQISVPARLLLGVGLFLSVAVPLAQAGSVISLKDNSQTSGKLTLQTSAVHIETGATPIDADLGTILEADFSDSPFQLNYFSSRLSPDQLPAGWKEANFDNATPPGGTTYAKGVLTVSGGGSDFQRPEPQDKFFFAGLPWAGDGQFSAHLLEIDPLDSHTLAGPMFRESLDALAVQSGMGTFAGEDGNGLNLGRGKTGDHEGWTGFPSQVPNWLHLTWIGNSLDLSVSTDGKA